MTQKKDIPPHLAPVPIISGVRSQSYGSNVVTQSATASLGGGGADTRNMPAPPTRLVRSATAPVAIYRKQPSLSSYQTTPISKHYALNNQILEAFESHYENKLYTVAYAIGLKFVETALLEIPKHGYFYSKRHADERVQSSLDAIRVSHLLKEIISNHVGCIGDTTADTDSVVSSSTTTSSSTRSITKNPSPRSPKSGRKLSPTRFFGKKKEKGGDSSSSSSFLKPPFSPSKGGKNKEKGKKKSKKDSNNSTGRFEPDEKIRVEKLHNLALQQCERASVGDYEEIRKEVEEELNKMHFAAAAKAAAATTTKEQKQKGRGRTSSSSSSKQKAAAQKRKSPTKGQPATKKHTPTKTSTTKPPRSAAKTADEDAVPPPANFVRQSTLTSTLLACGDTFSTVLCPGTVGEGKTTSHPPPKKSQGIVGGGGTTTYVGLEDTQKMQGNSAASVGKKDPPSVEAPTVVPIDPKPSTEEKQRRLSDLDLQRALFLSGLEVTPSFQQDLLSDIPEKELEQQQQQSVMLNDLLEDVQATTTGATEPPTSTTEDDKGGEEGKEEQNDILPISMLTHCYHEDFDSLRELGRVRISRVATYQGRIPDSTNGCTVIAPLLCIHHFHDDDNDLTQPDLGLLDSTIVQVIDEETPNILPSVRENLGLVRDAFLIPSDAHDSLMEQQYMCSEQFVNVCGGNVLDDAHLQTLVDCLNKPGAKKIAATLFFHEHVITILQLRRGSTSQYAPGEGEQQVWYDIIDSLPHELTLSKIGEELPIDSDADAAAAAMVAASLSEQDDLSAAILLSQAGTLTNDQTPVNSERSAGAFSDASGTSCGGNGGTLVVDLPEEYQDASAFAFTPPPNAARIRCVDDDSLRATLKWYACSVFSEENMVYIDTYKWEDMNSDFDPRVFQAFIWTEA